ncbi:hypothetical protein [Actinomadura madurae]|uniref:hypothetical protein n=1 Tax=Actinomadura madurae TaxID=1993 RepID=UPI0011603FAF|nr:hypothetical protein [Actinomadura madurae]
MDILLLRGEKANLQVLAEEIAADPALAEYCTAEINEIRGGSTGSFRYGHWAEITISIVTGLATNGLYDALRHRVARARDRGEVIEVEETSDDSNSSEASEE